MGNEGSIQAESRKNIETSKNTLAKYLLADRFKQNNKIVTQILNTQPDNPIYLMEESIQALQRSTTLTNDIGFTRSKINVNDIANIILTCYDLVEDVPTVIDYLIRLADIKDQEVIEPLEYIVSNITQIARARTNVYESHSFSSNVDSNMYPAECNLNSIISPQNFVKLLCKSSFKKDDINLVLSFGNKLPSLAVHPPSAENAIRSEGTQEFFTAGSVFVNGLSSNGNFLFLLIENNSLLTFPVLNGGAISAPRNIIIPEKYVFDQRTSVIADLDSVILIPGGSKKGYKIGIDQIIKAADSEIVEPSEIVDLNPSVLGYYSSGVSNVHFNKRGNDINAIINFKGTQETVKLRNTSKTKLSEHFPALVPNETFQGVLTSYSGQEISFVLRYSETKCIYRTFSALTGQFIHDYDFELPPSTFALTYDSFNCCHWAVINENDRMSVVRYKSSGCVDHHTFGFMATEDLDRTNDLLYSHIVLRNYVYPTIGQAITFAQFSPSEISDLHAISSAMVECVRTRSTESAYRISSLSILLTNGLRLSHHKASDVNKISEALTKLPRPIAFFVFFGAFDVFIEASPLNIKHAIALLSKTTDIYGRQWAIAVMRRSTALAKMPLTTPSALTLLFPRNAEGESQLHRDQLLIILIHQQVLVESVLILLKKEKGNVDLSRLAEYTQVLLNSAEVSLYFAKDISTFRNSLAYKLLLNFVHLLIPLSGDFRAAMVIAPALGSFVSKVNSLVDNTLDEDKQSLYGFRILTYTFGCFLATLFEGGNVSEFEQSFWYLFQANADMENPEKLSDPTVPPEFDDGRIQLIIHNNDCAQMKAIYTYKKVANARLKDDEKELDRLVLVALGLHTGVFQEMFDYTDGKKPRSETFNKILNAMHSIRNDLRQRRQKKDNEGVESLKVNALALIKLRPSEDFEEPVDDLVRFIRVHSIKEFIHTIKNMEPRNSMTVMSIPLTMSLIEESPRTDFTAIIANTISRIESFKGLATIIKYTGLDYDTEEAIKGLFMNMLQLMDRTQSSKLVLPIFRFYRDTDILTSVKEDILGVTLQMFDEKHSPATFALALSLLKGITSIPKRLMKLDKNALKFLLLSEAVRECKVNNEFFNEFEKLFWSEKGNKQRVACRVFCHMLESEHVPDHIVTMEYRNIIAEIGSMLKERRDLSNAAEFIWMIRHAMVTSERSRSILKDIIINTIDEVEDVELIGVMAVLGNMTEVLRPYCAVRFHESRTVAIDCISNPIQGEQNAYMLFSRPFSLSIPPRKVIIKNYARLYAVPSLTLQPKEFPYYDFIIGKANRCLRDYGSVLATTYMQVIMNYVTEQEFVEKVPDNLRVLMQTYPITFTDIPTVYNHIIERKKMSTFPANKEDVFYIAQSKSCDYITMFSRQFALDALPLSITLSAITLHDVYIGYVTNTVELYGTRYSLIDLGTRSWHPFNIVKKPPEGGVNEVQVQFIPKDRVFIVDGEYYNAPPGDIPLMMIISHKKEFVLNFTIDTPIDGVFDELAPADIVQHGAISSTNELKMVLIPKNVSDINGFRDKVSDYPKLSGPPVDDVYASDKRFLAFTIPPCNIIIHPCQADLIAKPLLKMYLRNVQFKQTFQWATAALMRFVIHKHDAIEGDSLLPRMFSLLMVPLEAFNTNDFGNTRIPFGTSKPIWSTGVEHNTVYLSLDSEMQEALRVITERPSFKAYITKTLTAMSNDRLMHLQLYPSLYHKYMLPGQLAANAYMRVRNYIIAYNGFQGVRPAALEVDEMPTESPVVMSNPLSVIRFMDQDNDVSIFYIDDMDNTWIFDTPFEILLYMKNLCFIADEYEQMLAIKMALIDMYLSQSPLIFRFLPAITAFINTHIPPIRETTVVFDRYVNMLASYINTLGDHSDYINFFFKKELMIQSSRSFALYGSALIGAGSVVNVECEYIDIGAMLGKQEMLDHRINLVSTFAHSMSSIAYVPVWDIFPLWLRVTGRWIRDDDPQRPKIVLVGDTVVIENSWRITFGYKFTIDAATPNSMISRSQLADFTQEEILTGADMTKMYFTDAKTLYFRCVEIPGGWGAAKITTSLPDEVISKINSLDEKMSIDTKTILSEFRNDMEQFAIRWTDEDTEVLKMNIPSSVLTSPIYKDVENWAKGTSLASIYGDTAVCLRALLLQNANYIWNHNPSETALSIRDNNWHLVSLDEVARIVQKDIIINPVGMLARASITIDRHTALKRELEGIGSFDDSIISQIGREIKKHDMKMFRDKENIWRVRFANEQAIDAGGPMRETLSQGVDSIFFPSSGLTVISPNGRRKHGPNQDLFVPFPTAPDRENDYWAVGVVLGIIMRTGLTQDVYFANIVFKYIAKETIGEADVLSLDEELATQVKTMRELRANKQSVVERQFRWVIDNWDGTSVVLPGKSRNLFVGNNEVEQFVSAAVQFLISQLKPAMKEIRRGFRENIGFKSHPRITGRLLARQVQGSSSINVDELQKLTVVSGGYPENDPNLKRFWEAVRRLNEEQLRLLLKFWTTMTRIPNLTVAKYQLQIDKLGGEVDSKLPTSSTCFYKLHLPLFSTVDSCFKKLVIAITLCQTMENQ